MQLTDVLQFVEATLDRISPARAQELAKQMASSEGREQVAKAAQDLVDWSQRNRERLRTVVQREVAAQLSAIGISTKSDYDALERRVSALERTSRKRTTAKRSASKRTTAKRSASSRTTGKPAGNPPSPPGPSAPDTAATRMPRAVPSEGSTPSPESGGPPGESETTSGS